MASLVENQNNPELVKLLKASTVAYSNAKSGEIKITYFLLFLAVAYPICYLFIKDDNIKLVLFGCSFLLTILIQIFSSSFKGNTSKGAIFKEEFDTIIFNLPWKSTLKKPDRREVLHFSQLYKGAEIKDWYSPNLSANIDNNIAVAILQHSNTSWDIELRKVYRRWLTNFLVFYSIVLFAFFVVLKVDAMTIFLLLFSLLSVFTHFITLIRGHSGTIDKRERISKHLDEIIRNKKYIGSNELRDIQDEIYSTRQEAAKVPNFFFRWYQEQMNSEAEEYISEVNNLYK
jgi:ABC-type multidrug transport system fused ATPase/permease subunit